jgi:hypothetical protein
MKRVFGYLMSALLVAQPLVSPATWAADQEKDEDRLKNCGTS